MTELSEEFETVFVRRNLTANPSFKTGPFSRFKTEFPNTNLYDDCHEIYKQLLAAERRCRQIDGHNLTISNNLSAAIGEVHPILRRAGKVADALHAEALVIPKIWYRYTINKYKLTPVLRGYYNQEQLEYVPLFIPGECEETERPFMTMEERTEDDVIRAQRKADELGAR